MTSTRSNPDIASVENAPAEPAVQPAESGGIFRSIRQRRRRRRRQVPQWAIWTATQLHRIRRFLRYGLITWIRARRYELISYAISGFVMMLLVLIMAVCVLPPASSSGFLGLVMRQIQDLPKDPEPSNIPEVAPPDVLEDLDVDDSASDTAPHAEVAEAPRLEEVKPKAVVSVAEAIPTDEEMATVFRQGNFGGRSGAGRQLAVRRFGGTVESEKAVNAGLKWLNGLQQGDGSWSFSNVTDGAQAGAYRENKVGATSLALLCFLGAGHTHLADGPYRESVFRGLEYIGKEAIVSGRTADLRGTYEGGNTGMYIHALATICVSEAHALEPRDRNLAKMTEMAVSFIVEAQDPVTGGWRYAPRSETSDTSVAGWQIMALQSAKAGRIRFSSKPLRLAREYLRSAQTDDEGAFYSYMPGQGRNSTMTAVALLCRMYLGWRRDNDALEKGVALLAQQGPSRENAYHNYYAAQVLHHWGGELWEKWNVQLREQLIAAQITAGPATGSWDVTDRHGNVGGQLYQTALSILTLEVYYRHLPLYRTIQTGETD